MTERSFERGEYGPNDRRGLVARFAARSGDATLEITPVRYTRRDGRDRFRSHVDAFEHRAETVAIRGPADVPPRTVFAAPRDPEDAVAVAATLSRHCPDGRALRDAVQDHGGAGGGPTTLSDDERLDARLAEEADRCLFRGVPTASHFLRLPLRYAVATDGYPHTDAGVPRVPTLVAGFDAAVSHDAWESHSPSGVDPSARIERHGQGEYELPAGDTFADGDAERLVLVRHYDVDPR